MINTGSNYFLRSFSRGGKIFPSLTFLEKGFYPK